MKFRSMKALAIAGMACLLIATGSAKASLIQDFTFDNGTNFSGSGTAVFDGTGGITDLDISGTAWQDTFSFENITGTGTIGANWGVSSWLWSASGNTDGGLNTIALLGFGISDMSASCFFSGPCEPGPGSAGVLVVFTPRHAVPEPGTLALFGLGLAGLGLARRRKAVT